MKTRLIVSDLDGSLLDEYKQVPKDFDETMTLMKEKGLQFAIATGRSYYDVQIRLNQWLDDIIVIAENGNHIVYQGETLYYAALNPILLKEVVKRFKLINKGLIVLCGLKKSYLLEGCMGFEEDQAELKKYYSDFKTVNDVEEIDDAILKVTICCAKGTQEHIYPHLCQYENEANVVVSAHDWMDITKKGEDKGKALSIMQDRLNFQIDETICFGDYLNDLSLADFVSCSYAMANAHDDLKAAFTDVIGSNEDGAVTQTIKMLLESL